MPRHYIRVPLMERLRLKSKREGDCLVWQGWCDADGYGRITISRTQAEQALDGKARTSVEGVHVVAYRLLVGPIPEGHQVQHSCNNPPCWEPTHLSTGLPQRNVAYRDACGRQARGERQGSARLTAAIVRQIRAQHADGGITFVALGRQYDLSAVHVRHIVHRDYWAHVP